MATYISEAEVIYGLLTTNKDKLAYLRQFVRNRNNIIMHSIIRNGRKIYGKVKFGHSFLVDLIYFVTPPLVKKVEKKDLFIEKIHSEADGYVNLNTKSKQKVIGKYVRQIRKSNNYSGSTLEQEILKQRRITKEKFGIDIWSDLAYYMYN